MKKLKTFDCQKDFPKEIKEDFFNRYSCRGNDIYIELDIVDIDCNPVTKWLSQNGAKKDEMVLVKYWW